MKTDSEKVLNIRRIASYIHLIIIKYVISEEM